MNRTFRAFKFLPGMTNEASDPRPLPSRELESRELGWRELGSRELKWPTAGMARVDMADSWDGES